MPSRFRPPHRDRVSQGCRPLIFTLTLLLLFQLAGTARATLSRGGQATGSPRFFPRRSLPPLELGGLLPQALPLTPKDRT